MLPEFRVARIRSEFLKVLGRGALMPHSRVSRNIDVPASLPGEKTRFTTRYRLGMIALHQNIHRFPRLKCPGKPQHKKKFKHGRPSSRSRRSMKIPSDSIGSQWMVDQTKSRQASR